MEDTYTQKITADPKVCECNGGSRIAWGGDKYQRWGQKPSIIARQRSFGKVMLSVASVCLQGCDNCPWCIGPHCISRPPPRDPGPAPSRTWTPQHPSPLDMQKNFVPYPYHVAPPPDQILDTLLWRVHKFPVVVWFITEGLCNSRHRFRLKTFYLEKKTVSSFPSLTINVSDKPGCKLWLCNHLCVVRFNRTPRGIQRSFVWVICSISNIIMFFWIF